MYCLSKGSLRVQDCWAEGPGILLADPSEVAMIYAANNDKCQLNGDVPVEE